MDYFVLKCYVSIQGCHCVDNDLSSSFRGLWGRNLKKTFCFHKNTDCKDCASESCLYFHIFEKKYGENDEYRPYIIYHNKENVDEIEIQFIFFGFLCNHSEKILIPIIQLHQQSLYFKDQKFLLDIKRVEDQYGQIIFNHRHISYDKIHINYIIPEEESGKQIRITFITPLRMKFQNQLMRHFNFEAFVKSLIRRISFINTYFNEAEDDIPIYDPKMLECEIKCQLKWVEKYRRSLRQNQSMSIGGLMGYIELKNPHPKLLYLLRIGEIVQVGKQTSFGNGKYIFKNEKNYNR